MATLYAKTAGGNWSAAGTWSNVNAGGGDSSGPPTAADDVVFELLSGNVTITSGTNVCRSLDCTSGTGSYTGTLTHNSDVTLSIGDGTAGAGNVALKFASGMTYTKGSTQDSALEFTSTSATQQTITTAGKVLGNTTFNGAGSSYLLSDALSADGHVNTFLTLTKGTLNTNGQTVSIGGFESSLFDTRTLSLGASSVTVVRGASAWATSPTNFTFNAGTSTITFTSANVSFTGSGFTYNNVIVSGGFDVTLLGASPNTFTNLTFTGFAAIGGGVRFYANQTISGTLTVSGNSSVNRFIVRSDISGTARTITAGAVVSSNSDWGDITAAGAASWDLSGDTGGSGDCGGNTGITFTPSATQTWSGTTGGNWSANAWSGRMPLPQDDVVINAAFTASQTVTLNVPRAGRSINWTGATGNPTWAKTTSTSIYGSVTMIAGMTNSGTSTITMAGQSANTFTSGGQTLTNPLVVDAIGGTVTLQDTFSSSSTGTLTNGTLSLNNQNATFTTFSTSNSNTRTLTLGSGILTLTSTGTVFTAATATNLTVTATTGTIRLSDTSASSKTFAGGGKTYGILDVTTGGAGAVIITGANTFTRITATGGTTKTFTLPGSTTTTLTGSTPFPSGAAGNLLTFAPSSGSATVSFSQQAAADYVSLTNIIAAGVTPAYAGTHSTNGGGNTNWLFSDPPAGGGNDPVTSIFVPLLL